MSDFRNSSGGHSANRRNEIRELVLACVLLSLLVLTLF